MPRTLEQLVYMTTLRDKAFTEVSEKRPLGEP
jgi:hypothetical protein